MLKQRPDYSCADCGIDIDRAGEYSWIVHDVLWKKGLAGARRRRGIHNKVSQRDLVCIGCFEKRIHRPLTSVDFDWSVRLNYDQGLRSKRLLERMGPRLIAIQQLAGLHWRQNEQKRLEGHASGG